MILFQGSYTSRVHNSCTRRSHHHRGSSRSSYEEVFGTAIENIPENSVTITEYNETKGDRSKTDLIYFSQVEKKDKFSTSWEFSGKCVIYISFAFVTENYFRKTYMNRVNPIN